VEGQGDASGFGVFLDPSPVSSSYVLGEEPRDHEVWDDVSEAVFGGVVHCVVEVSVVDHVVAEALLSETRMSQDASLRRV